MPDPDQPDGPAAEIGLAAAKAKVSAPATLAVRFPPNGDLARATLVVTSLVALAILAWEISSVILLAFGAILVAVGLRSLGEGIRRLTHIPMTVAVGLAIGVVVLVVGGFAVLLGGQFSAQARAIVADLPSVLDSLGNSLGIEDFGPGAIAQIESWFARPGLVESLLGITAGLIAVGGNLLIAVTVGIYFAFRPEAYEGGLLRLAPKVLRRRLEVAFDKAGDALHLWLRAQLLSMLLVGILTSLALMVIGVPSWLALGVLAGLLEFIPYAGPFLAAMPAVLIAVGDGGSKVFWVIGALVIVQQLEGSVITPMMQQRVADLPPVVAILSLAAMGVAFGPIGVLLAIPIAIVAMVLITQLYVRGALHDAEA